MRIETTVLISLWFLGLLSIPFVMCWIMFDVFPNTLGVPHEEATVKTTKTIPCKTLDDKAGTKECKVTLDDGRTVTCVVGNRGRSCDWRHAK